MLNPDAFDSFEDFQKARLADGLKNGWTPIPTQVDEVVEDVVKHYGVRGMKWGVRRKATVGPQEVVVRDVRKKIKTSGGSGYPAHPDAIRVRTIGQKGKESGLKSLSNEELRVFNERLNLEQNAKRLTFQDQSKPKRFISTLLGKGVSRGVERGAVSGGKTVGTAIVSSPYVQKRAAVGAAALALIIARKKSS